MLFNYNCKTTFKKFAKVYLNKEIYREIEEIFDFFIYLKRDMYKYSFV